MKSNEPDMPVQEDETPKNTKFNGKKERIISKNHDLLKGKTINTSDRRYYVTESGSWRRLEDNSDSFYIRPHKFRKQLKITKY